MKKTTLICFILIWICNVMTAQSPFHVTLLSNNAESNINTLVNDIKSEVGTILSSRYEVVFNVVSLDDNINNTVALIQQAYDDPKTDVVVGVGLNICNILSQRGDYTKPTILTFVIDNDLQNIPITPEGTSGVTNFTYIQSPFDVERDFRTLYEIKPFKKIALLGSNFLNRTNFDFDTYFKNMLTFSKAEYDFILVNNNQEGVSEQIPEDTDAVYVFPLGDNLSQNEIRDFLQDMTERGIPTFSLLSWQMLDQGIYAAYETDGNLDRIQRRVALNVMKIAEGQPAADLSVKMDNFTENLIINMKTVRESGHYPGWETLAKAVLINVTEARSATRALTLQSAIATGLQNNLGIKIAQKEIELSEKDIDIARSNYLPQIDASSTALLLDKNTVEGSFGTRGYLNWSANVSLSQLILSEPALANISIQKLLHESEKQSLRQNELDVILDISNAYLNILKALELVRLRNENVRVTRKNYDISKIKEQVGYAGTSDVYRWESELALDNVDLNTALAQLEQARFYLNSLLNRPITEAFELQDVALADSVLLVMDGRLLPLINNPGDLDLYSDFLVQEAFTNLPEIKQIEASIAAQERSLKSQNRAFYLPSVALSAQYDYPIDNYYYPEGVVPIDGKSTYNAALIAQIPLFQGNSRRHQKEQTKIGLFQLEDRMADLRNKLELQVRSNMEVAGASFSNVGLSQQASEAARKNFEIAQNSYQQGLLNITSLIDAQNAYLQAQINATNAEYTFISDFLAVERSVGYYHFLALPQEQQAYFLRFAQFMTKAR